MGMGRCGGVDMFVIWLGIDPPQRRTRLELGDGDGKEGIRKFGEIEFPAKDQDKPR